MTGAVEASNGELASEAYSVRWHFIQLNENAAWEHVYIQGALNQELSDFLLSKPDIDTFIKENGQPNHFVAIKPQLNGAITNTTLCVPRRMGSNSVPIKIPFSVDVAEQNWSKEMLPEFIDEECSLLETMYQESFGWLPSKSGLQHPVNTDFLLLEFYREAEMALGFGGGRVSWGGGGGASLYDDTKPMHWSLPFPEALFPVNYFDILIHSASMLFGGESQQDGDSENESLIVKLIDEEGNESVCLLNLSAFETLSEDDQINPEFWQSMLLSQMVVGVRGGALQPYSEAVSCYEHEHEVVRLLTLVNRFLRDQTLTVVPMSVPGSPGEKKEAEGGAKGGAESEAEVHQGVTDTTPINTQSCLANCNVLLPVTGGRKGNDDGSSSQEISSEQFNQLGIPMQALIHQRHHFGSMLSIPVADASIMESRGDYLVQRYDESSQRVQLYNLYRSSVSQAMLFSQVRAHRGVILYSDNFQKQSGILQKKGALFLHGIKEKEEFEQWELMVDVVAPSGKEGLFQLMMATSPNNPSHFKRHTPKKVLRTPLQTVTTYSIPLSEDAISLLIKEGAYFDITETALCRRTGECLKMMENPNVVGESVVGESVVGESVVGESVVGESEASSAILYDPQVVLQKYRTIYGSEPKVSAIDYGQSDQISLLGSDSFDRLKVASKLIAPHHALHYAPHHALHQKRLGYHVLIAYGALAEGREHVESMLSEEEYILNLTPKCHKNCVIAPIALELQSTGKTSMSITEIIQTLKTPGNTWFDQWINVWQCIALHALLGESSHIQLLQSMKDTSLKLPEGTIERGIRLPSFGFTQKPLRLCSPGYLTGCIASEALDAQWVNPSYPFVLAALYLKRMDEDVVLNIYQKLTDLYEEPDLSTYQGLDIPVEASRLEALKRVLDQDDLLRMLTEKKALLGVGGNYQINTVKAVQEGERRLTHPEEMVGRVHGVKVLKKIVAGTELTGPLFSNGQKVVAGTELNVPLFIKGQSSNTELKYECGIMFCVEAAAEKHETLPGIPDLYYKGKGIRYDLSRPSLSTLKDGYCLYSRMHTHSEFRQGELAALQKKGKDSIIGKGGNSEIFLFHTNERDYALRKTSYRFREYDILLKLYHPNVLPLLAAYWGEPKPKQRARYFIYYQLPLMTCDLSRLLGIRYPTTPSILGALKDTSQVSEINNIEKQTDNMLLCVMRGLRYLHGLRILHRDIKKSNVLVGKKCDCSSVFDGECAHPIIYKITDFDSSLSLDENGHFKTSCSYKQGENAIEFWVSVPVGTDDYRAPETTYYCSSKTSNILYFPGAEAVPDDKVLDCMLSRDIYSLGVMILSSVFEIRFKETHMNKIYACHCLQKRGKQRGHSTKFFSGVEEADQGLLMKYHILQTILNPGLNKLSVPENVKEDLKQNRLPSGEHFEVSQQAKRMLQKYFELVLLTMNLEPLQRPSVSDLLRRFETR